jgi:hypothetical protein
METSRVSARQPRFFLLLVQKKEPKEKDTPHHVPSGFLALLDKAGGCATRPNRPQKRGLSRSSNSARRNPCLACAAQHGVRGKEQPSTPPSPTQSPTKLIEIYAIQVIATSSQIPFLPRRAAQSRRGLSVINCPSSAAG